MSIYFFFILSSLFCRLNITEDKINAALNKQAPNIDPKGINTVVSESLLPAIIAVRTSGAPFANAKKVTPAKVGDISIF